MDQDTQKNAAMVEESTAASHSLAREVASLNELLSQFRLADGPNAPAIRLGRVEHKITEASPVRNLRRRITTAFEGNAAVDTASGDWEEF
jgi:methyl-accepting chemotaxis protein